MNASNNGGMGRSGLENTIQQILQSCALHFHHVDPDGTRHLGHNTIIF